MIPDLVLSGPARSFMALIVEAHRVIDGLVLMLIDYFTIRLELPSSPSRISGPDHSANDRLLDDDPRL
jgi:hypothetical protein